MAGRTAECQGKDAWSFCQRSQEANAMRIGQIEPLSPYSMLTPHQSECPECIALNLDFLAK